MKPFLAICLSFVMVDAAFADAAFQSPEQMMDWADAIAVVEISEVKEGTIQGEYWNYRKSGEVKTTSIVKGELPEEFRLYGEETFKCAQCPIKEGRYLAFLKKSGELWTGSNWQFSLRPIDGETVEWYGDDLKPVSLPLKTVCDTITERLKSGKMSPRPY